ncbi:PGPGW domain-containing protein [Brooklawnia sp.]|uniref:PGPGW domain-containing protein n=1 Tax=Brooklawnia sp. TaxID=2699740 RepID=UPI00311F7280
MAQPVDCLPRPVRAGGATRVDHERPDPVKWRARLKATPTGRYWLRIAVALLGFGLIIAAGLTGWLPGPGGIPLFLTGLAVLSSEFLWAKSVNRWLMRYVRIYVCWNTNTKRLFWASIFVMVVAIWWISLVIAGIPGWLPQWASALLDQLPGVD